MKLLVVRMWPSRCRVCFWVVEGLVEPLLAQLALLHEHVAQPVLEPLGGGVGHHHHAVLEGDGDALLLVA